MEIVKALKCVDEVVRETNLDKLVAWEELKFDRIFKGDDWKGSQLWNNYEKEFLLRNVEVVYFSYTVHTSSTLLYKKMIMRFSIGKNDVCGLSSSPSDNALFRHILLYPCNV